jgi:hypothetical protein
MAVLGTAYLWSLIVKANDANLSGDDLELSSLIAPVPLPEEAPPPPEKQPEKKVEDDLPTRKENIANLMETPPDIPDKTSTEQLKSKARPNSAFKIGDTDAGEAQTSTAGPPRADGGGGGDSTYVAPVQTEGDEPDPQDRFQRRDQRQRDQLAQTGLPAHGQSRGRERSGERAGDHR